jgi:glc operon protein GlcG
MSTDVLTVEIAQQMIAKAFKLATEGKTAVAAVVTDSVGDIIAAARMAGVAPLAISLAARKARTATTFKAPVGALLDMISKDEITLRALSGVPELLLLPGATPVAAGGRCVGAIGIAGAHHSQDQAMSDQIAAAG